MNAKLSVSTWTGEAWVKMEGWTVAVMTRSWAGVRGCRRERRG